jgi:hypothetical protein
MEHCWTSLRFPGFGYALEHYIYIFLIFDLGLVLILDIKIETHVSCI